jgi:quercetin dioxygenase-like cupin family protein
MEAHGSLADLPVEEPYEGLARRTFDSEGATLNEYVFEPGTRFPIHRHPQEQITLIEEGEVELTVAGGTTRLCAGDRSVVGPDLEHGIRAGEQGARILAIVVPRRSAPVTVVG